MKNIIILACCFIVVGCAENPFCPDQEIQYVNKEVFVPPKFDMPKRPVLRDYTANNSDGEVARLIQLDVIDLDNYATQLENLLNDIKNSKIINNK